MPKFNYVAVGPDGLEVKGCEEAETFAALGRLLHDRDLRVKEAKEKEQALTVAQDSERDATDKLFLALLNQARAGRFSRQMGQRLDSLAALAEAAHIRPDERLRDEAIAAMALPDVRRVPAWHPSRPPGTTLKSPSGTPACFTASASSSATSVPGGEGLTTIALPTAIAGATFQLIWRSG